MANACRNNYENVEHQSIMHKFSFGIVFRLPGAAFWGCVCVCVGGAFSVHSPESSAFGREVMPLCFYVERNPSTPCTAWLLFRLPLLCVIMTSALLHMPQDVCACKCMQCKQCLMAAQTQSCQTSSSACSRYGNSPARLSGSWGLLFVFVRAQNTAAD